MKRILLFTILAALPFIVKGRVDKSSDRQPLNLHYIYDNQYFTGNFKPEAALRQGHHTDGLPENRIRIFVDRLKHPRENVVEGKSSAPLKVASDQSGEVLDSIVGKTGEGDYHSKDVYTYDSSKSIASISSYFYDFQLGKWVKHSSIHNQYDSQGNKVSQIYYYYEYGTQPETLAGGYKEEFGFDGSGNETEWIGYSWDKGSSTWVSESKTLTSYDASGKPKGYVSYEWQDGEGWTYSEKGEVTAYDNAGNLTQYVGYEWDTQSSQWVLDEKADISYNSNNQVVLLIDYYYDSDVSGWVYDGKTETTYHTNKKVETETNYTWNTSAGSWTNSSRYEYAYDLNDNQISETFFYWDDDSDIWKGGSKYEYSYDANRRLTTKDEYYSMNDELTTWVLSTKNVYYYSPYNSSGIADGAVQAKRITLSREGSAYYLNVPDGVWASGRAVSYLLLSPSGKVFQKRVIDKENNAIQLDGLTKGAYVLVIYQGNQPIESLKFIKR